MKIREKILESIFLISWIFQLQFYSVHLFYLCRNYKHNNWWRHKVGHAQSIQYQLWYFFYTHLTKIRLFDEF